jgi:hypothetical protein
MYPFDNYMVDKSEHSNQLVVNTVDIEGAPEDVFELLASEDGRTAWLEPDPERTIVVEDAQPPSGDESGRISWWWWSGDAPPRQVELWVVAIPAGARVIAIERAPALPLTMLAQTLPLTMFAQTLPLTMFAQTLPLTMLAEAFALTMLAQAFALA